MPAWMTSLLRELVSLPMVSPRSSRMTSRPLRARARAMASPMTPAPTTTQSTLSVIDKRRGFCRPRDLVVDATVRLKGGGHEDLYQRRYRRHCRHNPLGRSEEDP